MVKEEIFLQEKKNFKSGFVAIVGRPNVGKSTLLNQILGQKVAITSDKPQTTRHKILGVFTEEQAQIIFLDTPGIHKPMKKLGEYMAQSVENSLQDIDAVLFVVDVNEQLGAGERLILERLQKINHPIFLVINKIDCLPKEKQDDVLKIIQKYKETAQFSFARVMTISAQENIKVRELLNELEEILPVGVKYYPDDTVTDQTERVIAGELIREKILMLTHDEVPHSIAVEVEQFLQEETQTSIQATIYVERDTQKPIVLGAGGALLRGIKNRARRDIEKLVGTRVKLDLWVKVRKDWRNKEKSLKDFGFKKE